MKFKLIVSLLLAAVYSDSVNAAGGNGDSSAETSSTTVASQVDPSNSTVAPEATAASNQGGLSTESNSSEDNRRRVEFSESSSVQQFDGTKAPNNVMHNNPKTEFTKTGYGKINPNSNAEPKTTVIPEDPETAARALLDQIKNYLQSKENGDALNALMELTERVNNAEDDVKPQLAQNLAAALQIFKPVAEEVVSIANDSNESLPDRLRFYQILSDLTASQNTLSETSSDNALQGLVGEDTLDTIQKEMQKSVSEKLASLKDPSVSSNEKFHTMSELRTYSKEVIKSDIFNEDYISSMKTEMATMDTSFLSIKETFNLDDAEVMIEFINDAEESPKLRYDAYDFLENNYSKLEDGSLKDEVTALFTPEKAGEFLESLFSKPERWTESTSSEQLQTLAEVKENKIFDNVADFNEFFTAQAGEALANVKHEVWKTGANQRTSPYKLADDFAALLKIAKTLPEGETKTKYINIIKKMPEEKKELALREFNSQIKDSSLSIAERLSAGKAYLATGDFLSKKSPISNEDKNELLNTEEKLTALKEMQDKIQFIANLNEERAVSLGSHSTTANELLKQCNTILGEFSQVTQDWSSKTPAILQLQKALEKMASPSWWDNLKSHLGFKGSTAATLDSVKDAITQVQRTLELDKALNRQLAEAKTVALANEPLEIEFTKIVNAFSALKEPLLNSTASNKNDLYNKLEKGLEAIKTAYLGLDNINSPQYAAEQHELIASTLSDLSQQLKTSTSDAEPKVTGNSEQTSADSTQETESSFNEVLSDLDEIAQKNQESAAKIQATTQTEEGNIQPSVAAEEVAGTVSKRPDIEESSSDNPVDPMGNDVDGGNNTAFESEPTTGSGFNAEEEPAYTAIGETSL